MRERRRDIIRQAVHKLAVSGLQSTYNMPSAHAMAVEIGCTEKQIDQALDDLVAAGCLRRMEFKNRHSRQPIIRWLIRNKNPLVATKVERDGVKI